MIDYIKNHEQYVLSLLDTVLTRETLAELLACHDKQIVWMQHERMAHLITMMFVCLFSCFLSVTPSFISFSPVWR